MTLRQPDFERSDPSRCGSFPEALEDIVQATQSLVVSRLKLLSLDVQEIMQAAVLGGLMVRIGTALLIGGWAVLQWLAAELLEPHLPWMVVLVVIGAVNVVLGGLLIAFGVREMRSVEGGYSTRSEES